MKNFISSILIGVLITTLLYLFSMFCTGLQDDTKQKLEKAYFEGQKDYAKGDVRIKQISDSCWVWSKSPWNDNSKPMFNAAVNCTTY